MSACKKLSYSCGALAIAASFLGLTSAGAVERAPYRVALVTPFPPIVQQSQVELAPAELTAVAEQLFALADPYPIVALTGQRLVANARAEGAFDVAASLLSDDQRTIAFMLDNWCRAPLSGANAAERRRQRAAIAAVYAARAYAPIWRGGGESDSLRQAASSVTTRLRSAGEDGLDLRAYPLPAADQGVASIEDEFALSEAVVAYAEQASGSRIDPQSISHLIGARPSLPKADAVLTRVAAAGAQAGDVLNEYNPQHYGYQLLKTKLAELRSEAAADRHAPSDLVAAAGPANDDGPPFRKSRRRGVEQSRASAARLQAEVIANMERWRWLPRDLGDSRIEVNIPDFELAVVRDGEVTHRARVIVGKEQTPTPVFSNAMQFIIVNPYWNVPPSILNKEMLPQNGGDLSAIQQRGFLVSYRHGKLSVRQPPGEKNALGRIKFMFPNDFSVYLHDTPSRGLFAASHRAFSHGCMRVDQPFALAEAVLGPESGWSEQRVRRLIGGSERYINLNKPLPIHIEYFTAYVDEDGQLRLRGDLYGYSARVRNALGLGT
jgi:murein L,D-transpeptidase YcbB/YkuD